jgi:hypothetical protein
LPFSSSISAPSLSSAPASIGAKPIALPRMPLRCVSRPHRERWHSTALGPRKRSPAHPSGSLPSRATYPRHRMHATSHQSSHQRHRRRRPRLNPSRLWL